MYTLSDIKVTLLNPDEVKKFIYNHGYIATVCYNTPEKHSEKVGLSCMKDGHFSGSRGDYFKFEIECPRFTADQVVRSEVGVFKNMQSQRYVSMDKDFSIYVPPKVMENPALKQHYEQFEEMCKHYYATAKEHMNAEGIVGEKANDLMRTMLPIGVKSKLRIGFTIEALKHFMNKRLCLRADEPIRKVAQLMKDEVLKVEPRYSELLVSQCEYMMFCPEKHGCGKYPSKQEVLDFLIVNGYRKNPKED